MCSYHCLAALWVTNLIFKDTNNPKLHKWTFSVLALQHHLWIHSRPEGGKLWTLNTNQLHSSSCFPQITIFVVCFTPSSVFAPLCFTLLRLCQRKESHSEFGVTPGANSGHPLSLVIPNSLNFCLWHNGRNISPLGTHTLGLGRYSISAQRCHLQLCLTYK